MKTTLIALLALLIGFAIGTFYGWRTGVVDGQILTSLPVTWLVENYGPYRETNDIQSRDKTIDLLEIGLGTNLAVNNGLSPVAAFITQPKADCGLLDIAACWQLDHPDDNKPLFPAGSASAMRLNEVMAKYKGYYDTTLQRQTDKREKAKEQKQ